MTMGTLVGSWPVDYFLTNLLTPLAILVTAVFAWLYHRRISAKRATLEFAARAELGNPAWLAGRIRFGELTNGWTNSLAKPQNQVAEDVPKIVLYLNHCELVAVAIHQKAMDEAMYKLCGRTAYLQTWKLAKGYIKERRRTPGHETLYENFGRLAEKWERES